MELPFARYIHVHKIHALNIDNLINLENVTHTKKAPKSVMAYYQTDTFLIFFWILGRVGSVLQYSIIKPLWDDLKKGIT